MSLRFMMTGQKRRSQIILNIEVHGQSIHYRMNSDTIEFIVDETTPLLTRLSIKGDFFRGEDLPYWLRGLKNYIQLEAKQGGIAKWFLDRFWLRMTPSQRRIAIIVIIAEGIGLAALIAVAVALRITAINERVFLENIIFRV